MGTRADDLPPHLRRVHDHVDRHDDLPLDLDDLVAVSGVSRGTHLVRCVRAVYGETPDPLLTRRRIERAQDPLREQSRRSAVPARARTVEG